MTPTDLLPSLSWTVQEPRPARTGWCAQGRTWTALLELGSFAWVEDLGTKPGSSRPGFEAGVVLHGFHLCAQGPTIEYTLHALRRQVAAYARRTSSVPRKAAAERWLRGWET